MASLRWLAVFGIAVVGLWHFNPGGILNKASLTHVPTAKSATSTKSVAKWKDANGHVVFGDANEAPAGSKVETVKLKPLTTMDPIKVEATAPKVAESTGADGEPLVKPQMPRNIALEKLEHSLSKDKK